MKKKISFGISILLGLTLAPRILIAGLIFEQIKVSVQDKQTNTVLSTYYLEDPLSREEFFLETKKNGFKFSVIIDRTNEKGFRINHQKKVFSEFPYPKGSEGTIWEKAYNEEFLKKHGWTKDRNEKFNEILCTPWYQNNRNDQDIQERILYAIDYGYLPLHYIRRMTVKEKKERLEITRGNIRKKVLSSSIFLAPDAYKKIPLEKWESHSMKFRVKSLRKGQSQYKFKFKPYLVPPKNDWRDNEND